MRAWVVSGAVICALAACGGGNGGGDAPGQDAVVDVMDAAADVAPDEGGEPDALGDVGEDVPPDGSDVPDLDAPDEDTAPDVVPDVEDTGDVDGLPDAEDVEDVEDVEPETLAVEAGLAADLCGEVCADVEDACGLDDVGGTLAACRAGCEARVAGDGWWLAGYFCQRQACDATACGLDDGPLAPGAECAATCTALDDCDFLPHVRLPADEPDICRTVCTGMLASGAQGGEAMGCMASALEDACDADALGECLGVPVGEIDVSCEGLCGRFFDEGDDAFCDAGTGLRAVWPDASACKSACVGGAESVVRATRIAGCALDAACADPTLCLDPAGDPHPACVEACDGLEDACAGGAPGSCVDLCTGALAWSGGVGTEAPGACIEAASCPSDADARLDLAVTCARPASAASCNVLCPELIACLPDAEMTLAGCLTACADGSLVTSATASEAADCAVAATDCAAVAKCVQAGVPDPVCAAMCDKLTTACELPAEGCQDACEDEVEAADGSLADVLCRLYSPCDDQTVCDGLGAFETPEACVSACVEAPGTCGDYADGCESACVGALTGNSLTVGAAACVVEALGPECDTEGVPACVQ